MKYKIINGVRIFAPVSRRSLIDFALKHHSLLVAVNAEKILNANRDTRNIINCNVGYSDGLGAVLALRKSGLKGVLKIPGCELWLDVIRSYYLDKSLGALYQKSKFKFEIDIIYNNVTVYKCYVHINKPLSNTQRDLLSSAYSML